MADAATDLTALYSPLPVPAPLGEGYKQTVPYSGGFTPEQEAMTKSLSGTDVTGPTPQLPFGSMPMFGPTPNVGLTPGGPVVDTTTFIPETIADKALEEVYEGQITEFQEAEEGGFARTTKSGREKKEHTGRKGARKSKKQDRKEDRWRRQGRTQNVDGSWSKKAKRSSDERLTGGDKRRRRRAQKDQRRESWSTYKGESDLREAEEAALGETTDY